MVRSQKFEVFLNVELRTLKEMGPSNTPVAPRADFMRARGMKPAMLKMILARMGIPIALLVAAIILVDNLASGADTPSTTLDSQWESLMLEGKSFVLVNDVQLKPGGTPYQTYEGKVGNTWISDRGIRLEDLR